MYKIYSIISYGRFIHYYSLPVEIVSAICSTTKKNRIGHKVTCVQPLQ